MSDRFEIEGELLLEGVANGEVLYLQEPISFWGGVDLETGRIIDKAHPQQGQSIAGKVIVLPGTRGSTASPGALLENIFAGTGPAAILLTAVDNACLIAVSMSQALGVTSPPLLRITTEDGKKLINAQICHVNNNQVIVNL